MSHSVHRSTETGNFVVANKEGQILHTFPTEGEANLQAQYLDEQEKLALDHDRGAKAKEPAPAKAGEDEPRHGRGHR